MGHDNPYLKKPYVSQKMKMTKRREQGHYNTTDRFVIVAYVDQYEVRKSHHLGTEPFDRIWRAAHTTTTHLVLRSGQNWLVTSMFSAKMNDRGTVEMGPHKRFTTEDAAIMYATIMASQEKEIMGLLTLIGKPVAYIRGRWIEVSQTV